ncbi:hypothetical protein KAR91_28560 [Candidatus Pacearchaeota archaeon]|nr:hypothetical protein [Candidatus Pacearchaeota archaeon]
MEKTGSYSFCYQRLWIRTKPYNGMTGLHKVLCSVIPKGKSVIDLGAGNGHLVKNLKKLGYEAFGIDGTPRIEELTKGIVEYGDLTSVSSCRWLYQQTEWVTFIEVGEHISKQFEQILIENVSNIPTEGLIITWCSPDQTKTNNRNHVNCQPMKYITQQFAKHGWIVDNEKTDKIKHNLRELWKRKRNFVVLIK